MRKLAIVVSEFNSLITDKMLEGALEEAYAQGLKDSQICIKKFLEQLNSHMQQSS